VHARAHPSGLSIRSPHLCPGLEQLWRQVGDCASTTAVGLLGAAMVVGRQIKLDELNESK
jgi:hypothetical protein